MQLKDTWCLWCVSGDIVSYLKTCRLYVKDWGMTCSRRKDTGDRHVETKIPQCRWTNSKQREHQLPEVQYQWAQTRQLVWTRTSTRRTQTMSVKTVPQLLSAGRQHTHSPVVHNRNTWKDNGASSRRLLWCPANKHLPQETEKQNKTVLLQNLSCLEKGQRSCGPV